MNSLDYVLGWGLFVARGFDPDSSILNIMNFQPMHYSQVNRVDRQGNPVPAILTAQFNIETPRRTHSLNVEAQRDDGADTTLMRRSTMRRIDPNLRPNSRITVNGVGGTFNLNCYHDMRIKISETTVITDIYEANDNLLGRDVINKFKSYSNPRTSYWSLKDLPNPL